ncbi:B-cell receptor CD22-like [Physella acuta]|uniref:B-cell receptor CD22-like n=1 Tax=Physella acuta TaxID=109671 RepID=UPI0027DAEEC5|nr:B-cell receptor CD22-like [Physella acuta]
MVRATGITATFTSATSTAVNQPTIPTTITGVYLSSVASPDPSGPKPDVPPVISAEAGSTVRVYCAVNDTDLIVTGSSSLTYKWKKGTGDITGETTNTLTLSSLAVGDAASYSCEATLGTTPYPSNPVQLNVESKIIDSVHLAVIPTTPVLTGYAVLDCQVKIADLRRVSYSWKKNSITMPNVTDRALQINNLVASDNTAYTCTATVGFDSATSSSTSLTAVALDSETPLVTSLSVNFGLGNKYTLTCGEAYTIPGLTYRWYEGATVVEGQTSKTYEITVKTGTTNYKCDIALGSKTSLKSATGLNVVAKQLLEVYINVGTVKMTGTYTPVTGTSVTLTCVATTAAGASGTVTYAWTKGVTPTGSGTSTLTITAGTDDGAYTCTAAIGVESLPSAALTVTSAVAVAKPVIGGSPDTYNGGSSTSYSEGGNYVLTCATTSHTPSLIYAWTKDGNPVGNSRVYQITSAKKGATGDDGSYICSAKSGALAAVASDPVTITIGDKGKPCLYVDDCDGDQYADVCENSRCVCATGYTLQGNTCSGQGIVTISMLLFVLCGLIKLIL